MDSLIGAVVTVVMYVKWIINDWMRTMPSGNSFDLDYDCMHSEIYSHMQSWCEYLSLQMFVRH